MNEIKLSKRLKQVAKYVPKDINKFADIGTDHAYLPCYICLNYDHIYAIAGEVAFGPYEAAVQQVQKYELQNKIEVRLGDGLQILRKGEVDCVTIAGMGGSLIRSILEDGLSKLDQVKRLILQPNIHAKSIRQFAMKYQYNIISEEILNDDGYVYELIVLEPTDEPVILSDKEQYLGPILLKNKNETFIEKWSKVYDKKKKIISQIEQAEQPDLKKLNQFKEELMWIEEEIFNEYDSERGCD